MKILIGIMFHGEAEFEDCIKSIESQKHNYYEIFKLEYLNSSDAHNQLYKRFMEESLKYDVFIKIDADMVISDDGLFKRIADEFEKHLNLDNLLMPLLDYYTNDKIYGVHAFRNTVKWDIGKETLYPDTITIKKTVRERIVWTDPVGFHCKNPNPFQAFHYGFHRALKAVQPGRIKAKLDGNWKTLRKVYDNYRKKKDLNIAYALCGAEEVFRGYYSEDNISYNDSLLNLFEGKYFKKSKEELNKFIMRKRIQRLAFLPYPFDYRYMFYNFRLKSIFRKIFK